MYSWKVRLGEEGVGADARLLAATLLQEHRENERVSGCCKVVTNSSEGIECLANADRGFVTTLN